MSSTFNWLHLSDLHHGQPSQSPLWPSIREAFFCDLEKIHRESGPWQLVIFSGDVVYSGTGEQFTSCTQEVFSRLWKQLEQLGSGDAKLFVVPGNHDLRRPAPEVLTPAQRYLSTPERYGDFKADLFRDRENEYLKTLENIFAAFTAWKRTVAHWCGPQTSGWLPGDCSALLQASGGEEIGLIGLNTTFLQLSKLKHQGHLEWAVEQLAPLCGGDVEDWCRQAAVSLLVTHQGPDWLSEASRDLYSEIYPARRFAAHLFGHMHVGHIVSISEDGTSEVRRVQAPSLSGLDYEVQESDGKMKLLPRQHGYLAGRIEFGTKGTRMAFWPRKAFHSTDGWHFRDDPKIKTNRGRTAWTAIVKAESRRTSTNSPSRSRAKERKVPFDPPARMYKNFVGQRDRLETIIRCLREGRRLLVTGPSGMGKSAAMAEGVARLEEQESLRQRYPDGVLTVSVSEKDTPAIVYNAICIGFRAAPTPDAREAARRIVRERKALVIIDSAEHFPEFGPFASAQHAGCVVGTSTKLFRDFDGEPVALEPLSLTDASTLLLDKAGLAADSTLDPAVIRRICELVGRLPFALRLVAGIIGRHAHCPPAEFVAMLEASPFGTLAEAEKGIGGIRFLLDKNASFTSEEGRRALVYLGLLGNRPVPVRALIGTVASSQEAVRRAVADLATSNLVEWIDADKDACVITHALAHAYAASLANEHADVVRMIEELCDAAGSLTMDEVALAGIRPHLVPLLDACLAHGLSRRAVELSMKTFVHHDPRLTWAEQGKALDLAARAAHAENDAANLVEIAAAQGLLAIVNAQYKEAVRILHGALSLGVDAASALSVGRIYVSLGRCTFLLGHFSQARRYFVEARDIFLPIPEMLVFATQANVGLAIIDWATSNYPEALTSYQAAIAVYDAILSNLTEEQPRKFVLLQKTDTLYQLAFTHWVLGDVEDGLAAADQAVSIAKNHLGGDAWILAYSLDATGFLLSHCGEIDKALENFQEAHALHQSANDEWGASLSGAFIGSILLIRGLINEAEEQFARAHTVQTRLEEAVLLGFTCCGLASIALEKKDLASAQRFLNEAMDVAQRATSRRCLAMVRLLRGRLLAAQHRHQEAIDLCQEAKTIYAQIGDVRGQVRADCALGEYLLARGDIAESKAALTTAMAGAARHRDRLGELAAVSLRRQVGALTPPGETDDSLAEREEILRGDLDVRGTFWLYQFA